MTRIRASLVVLSLALLAGCALHTPQIAEVKTNPGRYHDRRVSIDGVVTSAWGVPAVPFKIYKIDDGTGELTIVSRSSRLPTRGARVRVTGRISEVAVIGGESLGLHVVEESLHFKTS